MKGKYPKDFKWTGWHPNDLCYVIPIIKTEEQFWLPESERGKDNDEITDVPQGFKTWVANNQDRIARAEKRGTLPYFVRDNRERINKLPTSKIVQDSKQELENHTHVKAQTNEPNGSYMPNSLNTQEQKAWNENEYKIEIALNLKASNQMNFEEANHGKENPHYKDKGGNINCQTCTIVHEMRRRGYDVEALPNNNNRFAKLCKQENFSWAQRFLNVDGSDVDYDFTFNWIKNNGGGLMDSKKLGEYIAGKINVDGRFEIYCGWKKGKAHVFLQKELMV